MLRGSSRAPQLAQTREEISAALLLNWAGMFAEFFRTARAAVGREAPELTPGRDLPNSCCRTAATEEHDVVTDLAELPPSF